MKRRFFLIIMTLVLVLTLGACSLEGKEVELGVSASYQNEMVEGSAQQVEIEVADSTLNLEELAITWESSNPEIAEVTKDGLVKANKPGEVTIDVTVVLGEAKKELALEITVVEVVYVIEYELDGGQNSELNPAGFGGSLLPIELQPATKLGYKFLGWEYEGEFVEKLEVARNYKLVAKWELEEYSISYDVAGGEYEGEAKTVYTIYESVELPVPTKEGFEFKGWYAGEELVESVKEGSTGNLELVAKWELVKYTISYDLAGGVFAEGAEVVEAYTVEDEVVFLVPTKEGHRFLGWYIGEELVEGVEKGSASNLTVVAKWQAGYYINFDLAGGELSGLYTSYEDVAEAFLADYNKYSNSTATVSNFLKDTSKTVKVALSDPEMLAKWNWLFAYMLEDLKAYNEANGTSTSDYVKDAIGTYIPALVAGDTTAINCDDGGNTRTLIRSYLHGLLNKSQGDMVGNAVFAKLVPDFSLEENQKRLTTDENAPFIKDFYAAGSELPVPTKEGNIFQGWYNESDELVEKATEDGKLTAKWRDYYVIEFDLNGGEWELLYNDFAQIAEAFLADYNKYSKTTAKASSFITDTSASVKVALSDPEMLAKWNWLFAYMLEDLKAYNEGTTAWQYASFGKEPIEVYIPKLVAGDTNAINDGGANTRTLVRSYLHGILNKTQGNPSTHADFAVLVPDFSLEENQKALVQAYLDYAIPSEVKIGASLPIPVKGETRFLGWLNEAGEVVEVANADGKLVANWEVVVVISEVKFTLDGGVFAEGVEVPTEYAEGKGLAKLPTPTKEGYRFLGWYLGEERVEGISEKQTGNVELVAKWAELPSELIIKVGPNEEYQTLDAAIEAATDGYKIILAPGEYTLGVVINKSIEIVGPNADLAVKDFTTEKAAIKVTADTAGNLAAKNIVFNGVELYGAGRGSIAGVYFQDGGNVENVTFKSCQIHSMNTLVKILNGKSAFDLLIEDCNIYGIGQFIIWTATSSINKVTLIGNVIDGTAGGEVANPNAALFRIRSGYLEAYNNYFKGDSSNVPGYFEFTDKESIVKYNTFDSVTRFLFTTQSNKVVFDENLYINTAGKVLTSVPATLTSAGSGLKTDATLCTSEEDRYARYINSLLTTYPDRYFTVEFDAAGGELTSSAPTVYDTEVGIVELPTIEREKHIFEGWYLNGELVESIPAGTTGNLKIVAKWREDALIVDGTNSEGHYETLSAALAAVKEGEVIKLVAGEYSENVTITVPNIKIVGPNRGVNANTGTRVEEAVIKGVFTISSGAQGLTIDGLAFTGAAKVVYSENAPYEGFTFQNNKVYDTAEATQPWDDSRYTLPAFIQFTMSDSKALLKNVSIYNNSFVNVSEINVLANRCENLTVDGNVFKDFDLDAIRTEGGYVYGVLSFTNNVFEQTTAENGAHGILLYSVAGPSGSKTKVIIKNNSFIKLGKTNSTSQAAELTGAIGAYRYQENSTEMIIENNIFDHCYDYLYLRTNGANSTIYSCKVENNQFLGLPHNQYYGSYCEGRGDTSSSNPHLVVFTQNYYEDNDGKVITDLSAYEAYFKHMASYGTALAAKPGSVEVEPVIFWDIEYDLNGGEATGQFVYEYSNIDGVIALPTLTLTNHQFNGWLLNGVLVTEIPADASGDLYLIADFTVLEGEIYTIEYVTNKENVLWPSRAAENREEIVAELLSDLYEWAVSNGETKSYNDYEAYIKAELAAYNDIKLRNTKLGNYPAEDDSTEYFLNVPKYYQKWHEFFELFHEIMLNVNPDQSFYTDTYAAMVRMHQFVSWSSATGRGYFESSIPKMCAVTKVPAEIQKSYRGGQVVDLPKLSMANGLEFLGWYDNPEFTGTAIEKITSTDSGNKVYYAKWAEEVKVEKFEINKISELLLFETHQLVWTLTPNNATDKTVEFFSSNESVATVSGKGLITALSKGTTTITIRVYGNRELDVTFELSVYTNDYIDGGYETNSYVVVGDSIELFAEITRKDNTKAPVKWTSLTPEIATVDENGTVTALAAGTAKIVATDPTNESLKLEFVVVVLETLPTDILGFALESHESNVFTRYNLNIGGTYNKDILGSVSKVFANSPLVKNNTYYDQANVSGPTYGVMSSIEFITVHYTGNMAAGATAKANASYFAGESNVSIHYTTGNDGVYYCLDESKGAYHAGDGSSVDHVGTFEWIPTGVKVGATDPQYPLFTISNDFYYEINGQKTSVKMPSPYNYNSRNTDHILNADGTISSKEGYGDPFQNRTPESFINNQSLPFKVVNGEYYMGTTWWAYTQVYEGRICSTGGNRNSIGIESCVNEGSDLWWTWQKTAQLVADIMNRHNLDITRVRGHHFYTAKDCPQPMLENDLEIWYEFLELVEAEYELLTKYQGYEVSIVSNNPDIVDNNGRVIAQPKESTCVTYTITFTKDGESKSITLASMVDGIYTNR